MINLSLSAKLLLGFLLVAAPSVSVMAGISIYALLDLARVNRQLQDISRSLESVRALEAAVGRAVMPLSSAVVYGTAPEARRFEVAMNEAEIRLRSCAGGACHEAVRQPSEMAAGMVSYIQGIKERASTIFRGTHPDAARDDFRLIREINELGQEADRQLERMSAALLLRVESLQRKSHEVSRRAGTLILASIFSVIVLAVLSAYLISRRLLKPVLALLVGTRRVAEGDLGYRVATMGRDEIGELANSFNAMAEEIQGHRERLEKMVQAKTEELKRAQESLLQSEKLASLGLLASGVAHELNNPLTSILMNLDLLAEEAHDNLPLQSELKRISGDALRCQRIINDLRDFSRRHELEIVPADLSEIIRSALALVEHQLRLQGIALSNNLSSSMPRVPCDSDRLQQVLTNVFINAIQAMPEGGKLVVRADCRQEWAEIAVEDIGPGVPKELRAKIFDPFFTTKSKGTGLGLSIVYRIMEEHGGRVEIDSATREEVGPSGASGTTVRLYLPIAR
jgi:signal transduction histidine kinase